MFASNDYTKNDYIVVFADYVSPADRVILEAVKIAASKRDIIVATAITPEAVRYLSGTDKGGPEAKSPYTEEVMRITDYKSDEYRQYVVDLIYGAESVTCIDPGAHEGMIETLCFAGKVRLISFGDLIKEYLTPAPPAVTFSDIATNNFNFEPRPYPNLNDFHDMFYVGAIG